MLTNNAPHEIHQHEAMTAAAAAADVVARHDRTAVRPAVRAGTRNEHRAPRKARRRAVEAQRGRAGDCARQIDDARMLSSAAGEVERDWASLVRFAGQFTHNTQDAEDAVQTAWMIAARRPDVPSAGARPWLLTVIRHEAYRTRRRAAHEFAVDDVDMLSRLHGTHAVLHAPGPEADALLDVRAALAACRADERRVLIVRAGGWSYDAIADRLGWSYTKVDRSLKEGRARLRALVAA